MIPLVVAADLLYEEHHQQLRDDDPREHGQRVDSGVRH
jgi:hypothetical protein